MKNHFAAGLVVLAASAAPALAAAPQVFVSGKGADSGSCGSAAAPCRTFQYAHDAVAAGGVISVMDSGDYGPLKITKGVSVVNNGAGVAAISATAAQQNAIEINVASPAAVRLRGLTVDGANVAAMGLLVSPNSTGALALDISKSVFRNFKQYGIAMGGNAKVSFSISETECSDNFYGLVVISTAASDGLVKNSRLLRNGVGFWSAAGLATAQVGLAAVLKDVEIKDGYIPGGAASTGIYVSSVSGQYALTLRDVSMTADRPLDAGVASVRMSRSYFARVASSGSINGDYITSAGDNQVLKTFAPLAAPIVPLK